MTENSVRGAGRARAGATDTTMLIWKVIAANPGIRRQEIWERVEHDIPDGFALRRFPPKVDQNASRSTLSPLRIAKRRLLNECLISLERNGHVVADGSAIDRPFKAVRQPRYRGNPDAIDETGTKAAEHMALADALRIVEKMLSRANVERKHGPLVCLGVREYEAVTLLARTLRAKGSAGA